jgi:hypothetical protein
MRQPWTIPLITPYARARDGDMGHTPHNPSHPLLSALNRRPGPKSCVRGVHLALWLPLTLGLTVGLLQPVKGVIVVLQWRMGMHGFEPMKRCGARAQGAEAA